MCDMCGCQSTIINWLRHQKIKKCKLIADSKNNIV